MQGKDFDDYKKTLAQGRKDQANKAYKEAAYEKAIFLIGRVIADSPDDLDALDLRGNALQKLGRNEEADLDFRKVAELRKKDLKILGSNSSRQTRNDTVESSKIDDSAMWPGKKKELDPQLKRHQDSLEIELKKKPKDVELLGSYANLKFKTGFYEEVIHIVDERNKLLKIPTDELAAHKSGSRWDHCYTLRGQAKAKLGRYKEAIDDFSKAIHLHPTIVDAWLYRGRAKFLLGLYGEAVHEYDEAFKLIKTRKAKWCKGEIELQVYRERAKLLLHLGRHDEARSVIWEAKCKWEKKEDIKREFDVIKQICDYDKQRLESLKARGKANLKSKRFDNAVIDFSEAIKLDPKTATNWEGRGRAQLKLEHYQDAISDFDEAIRLDAFNVASLRGRAAAKQKLRRYEEAISDCSAALKLDPKSAYAWQIRGLAYKGLKLYEEAYRDFYEASVLKPGFALYFYYQGSVKHELGDYKVAINVFSKAIEIDPHHSASWQGLGLAKQKLKRYEEAMSDFDRAIQLDPKNLTWLRLIAKFCQELGWHENALSYWDRIIELDPDSANDWAERAATCVLLGRHEQAVSDYKKASKLDPKNGVYSLNYSKQLGALAWPDQKQSEVKQQSDPKIDSSKRSSVDSSGALILGPKSPMPVKDVQTTVVSATTQQKITELRSANDQVERRIKERGRRNGEKKISEVCLGVNPDLGAAVEVNGLDIISTERLKKIEVLRVGAFGIIYRGELQRFDVLCGMSVAIKELKTEGKLADEVLIDFRREVKIHARLDCPSIVKLLGICEQPLSMVMELVELGSLREVLDQHCSKPYANRIDWGVRLQIAKDIAMGVVYLHEQKPEPIIHGDLKSLNVLLNRDHRAKLCDFGLAKFKRDLRSRYHYEEVKSDERKPKGTLAWLAPELFSFTAMRTTRSDIFSLAVVLWELASFMLPYGDADDALIKLSVKDGEREVFSDEKTPEASEEYMSLVKSCWEGDANKRPTAGVVLVKLEAIYSKTPLAKTFFSKELSMKEKDDFNIGGARRDASTSEAKKGEDRAKIHLGSSGVSMQAPPPSKSYRGNNYF